MRLAIATIAALALSASAAHAKTETLDAVLASISARVPTPANVTIRQEPCPQVTAVDINCADPWGRIVYLSDRFDPHHPIWTQLTLAHELGHIWEHDHLDDEGRARYSAFVGATGPWLFRSERDLIDRPAFSPPPAGERLADAYSLCSLTPHQRRWLRYRGGGLYGGYGERIRRTELAATCWLIHQPQYR